MGEDEDKDKPLPKMFSPVCILILKIKSLCDCMARPLSDTTVSFLAISRMVPMSMGCDL